MKKLLLRILSWLQLAGAAAFLLVAALVGTLWATGTLNRKSAGQAWAVLDGRKRAVEKSDYLRWQKMEKETQTRTEVERQEQRGSGLAYEAFMKEKERRERELDREIAVLQLVDGMVKKRETEFTDQRKVFAQQRQAFLAQQKAAREREQDANLKKALRIIQGMDAELVAQDFQNRWNDPKDPDEKQKVVDLLRRMPARQSSEIISAIQDSTTRVAIMKEVRKAKS